MKIFQVFCPVTFSIKPAKEKLQAKASSASKAVGTGNQTVEG